MKPQAGNPLVNILGIEPRWPNPKESIGDFIKLIDDKNNCWKAKGPAREAFEDLAEDIKTHLDRCVDSIPGSDWVTWSIYMIGKTPQRAAPVVMFFCEEPGPRREAQKVIKQSGILERYTGIKIGNAALPPDLDQLEPLASDAVSREGTAKTEGSNLNPVISVFCNTVFITSHQDNTSSTRTATLGGIVQHNGDAYVLTAGHPFDETTPLGSTRESKVIDNEWEIDSDNSIDSDTEVDVYDEEFVEAMSRASNTPVDARSETSSNWDDRFSDTYSARSLQFSDTSNPAEDQFFDQPCQTQSTSCRVIKNWASEDTIPTMDVRRSGRNADAIPTSAATEGHLVVLSADLDYALVKFKDSNLIAANNSAGNKSALNPLRPTHVITKGPRDTEIVAYTASGGRMTGTLYGTPSYTRLPKSKTFQEVYTVRFNGPLAKGDCGSWVIDAETRGLYGHIIAGCERTGVAYITSAHNVFKNAKERLGGEVLLKGDLTSEATSQTDPTEIAEAVSAEDLTIAYLHSPTFNVLMPQIVDCPIKDDTLYKVLRRHELFRAPSSVTPFSHKWFDSTRVSCEESRCERIREEYKYHQTLWPTEKKRGQYINDRCSATSPVSGANINNLFPAYTPKGLAEDVRKFTRDHKLEDIEGLLIRGAYIARNPGVAESIPGLTKEEKTALAKEKNEGFWEQTRGLKIMMLTCIIATIFQGWSQASIAGSWDPRNTHSTWGFALINATPLAALAGAWTSDSLGGYVYSRRLAIFAAAAFCFFFVIGSAFERNSHRMLACRVLLGVSVGAYSAVVPGFIAEASPVHRRGTLVMNWQLIAAFGPIVGYTANLAVFSIMNLPWRLHLAAACLPAIPLMVLIFICPESPRFLMQKGDYKKALNSLCCLNKTPLQAARELLYTHEQIRVDQELCSGYPSNSEGDTNTVESQNSPESHRALYRYFTQHYNLIATPRDCRAVISAFAVMISQQLYGINILAFSLSMMLSSPEAVELGDAKQLGALQNQLLWLGWVFGLTTFLFASIGYKNIYKLRRKSLLLLIFISHLTITILSEGFHVRISGNKGQVGQVMFFIISFGAFHAPGLGSIEVFLLPNRFIPPHFRDTMRSDGAYRVEALFLNGQSRDHERAYVDDNTNSNTR